MGQRLAVARERAGLKQVELAVALGTRYDQAMISRVEAGKKGLRLDGAVKAAQELNVSLDYLTGLTDDERPAGQLAARVSELEQRRGSGRLAEARPPEEPAAELASERARVRVYTLEESASLRDAARRLGIEKVSSDPVDEARPPSRPTYVSRPYVRNVLAAAGNGAPVFDESDEFEIAISPSALKPWASPEAIVFIRAAGDSMLPDIRDGDLLAVDSSRVAPINGQVFVLRVEAGTVVKRLRRRGDRWHLVSDNPAYEPRPVMEDDRIVGQVAWVGPPSATDEA